MFNTVPYNSFPASKAQFEEGKNDAIQAEIDAMKDGTNIDSFGDVETALATKANSADVETALATKANSADVETALATKTNLSNIAPTFDATSGVYDVGDKVIYNGVLYEFTTAHSTAGDWDSSEVQAVKVSELINSLESGLNNLTQVKYFDVAVTSGEASYDYTNDTPSDYVMAISAISVRGRGVTVAQLSTTVKTLYFAAALDANTTIRIAYIAS